MNIKLRTRAVSADRGDYIIVLRYINVNDETYNVRRVYSYTNSMMLFDDLMMLSNIFTSVNCSSIQNNKNLIKYAWKNLKYTASQRRVRLKEIFDISVTGDQLIGVRVVRSVKGLYGDFPVTVMIRRDIHCDWTSIKCFEIENAPYKLS